MATSTTTIFSKEEILQKIEAMKEPGAVVSFFLGASPSNGGPLTRGAVVIELNPAYPGKKQKKYNIYTTDVEGVELKSKGQKMFDSDKPKDIANWVKERHYVPTGR